MSANSAHAVIIDDDANNLEVLASLLTAEGATVTTFNHPERAESGLSKLEKIDVVFCDLQMPKIDGFEMLHRLRAKLGRSVPVIAYTVHTSQIDVARRSGFDGFLGKPLDGERFSELFTRILKHQPVWEVP